MPIFNAKILPIIKQEILNISISVIEEKTDILVDMIDQGKIDFALLATPADNYQFKRKTAFKNKFFAAVAKNNPISKNKSICVSDLVKENLMILDEGHCLPDQTLKLCQLDDFTNRDFIKGSSLETLRQMVSINEGVTLIPRLFPINCVNS